MNEEGYYDRGSCRGLYDTTALFTLHYGSLRERGERRERGEKEREAIYKVSERVEISRERVELTEGLRVSKSNRGRHNLGLPTHKSKRGGIEMNNRVKRELDFHSVTGVDEVQ